ncbi:MAG TPA: hypothetical protein VLA56_15000 [Pseudomonadales bacterium]|nr:hypothetical protein [Pseudomonadales bacterium]
MPELMQAAPTIGDVIEIAVRRGMALVACNEQIDALNDYVTSAQQ